MSHYHRAHNYKPRWVTIERVRSVILHAMPYYHAIFFIVFNLAIRHIIVNAMECRVVSVVSVTADLATFCCCLVCDLSRPAVTNL